LGKMIDLHLLLLIVSLPTGKPPYAAVMTTPALSQLSPAYPGLNHAFILSMIIA
jgi:hypothetical protein